ncbi:tetratricopeptide repeat protein [Nocardioides ochotonae]|uniref:tetratricopeptide repeat protein n=1 Tax=Nocardioides ochotonae TaxID=2685869 RepID=UPI00140AA8B3|nr:tetratricopeptide repeat protein [Nocardioides ochotonae]
MTQQPFSRPGAIDLSALKRPAPTPPPAGGPAPAAPGGSGAPAGASAYVVQVDETNFQSTLEASMTAPVVLVFHSPSQAAAGDTFAADVAAVVSEHEGRFLAALIDVDASPQIAQAMQIPQVPLMLVLLDGRPATQPIPGPVPVADLRAMFTQLAQQLTVQGITDRHQPRHVAAAEGEEEQVDPRYAAAQDALGEGDIDRAVAEYQKLVDANPADAEAAAGLAMAKVLQRTQGVDLNTARAAAAANPDDIDAQTMVADLDMLGGHVEDAFNRLVDLVRRTAGAERTRARDHLLGLFAAVGNDDPRVLRGRQNLASALF